MIHGEGFSTIENVLAIWLEFCSDHGPSSKFFVDIPGESRLPPLTSINLESIIHDANAPWRLTVVDSAARDVSARLEVAKIVPRTARRNLEADRPDVIL